MAPTNSGDASCSVSVALTVPWLLRTGALKEHASPIGIAEGHENASDPAVSSVEPFGVAVTVTLPAAFGASDNEEGLIAVVNDPDTDTIKGARFAAA